MTFAIYFAFALSAGAAAAKTPGAEFCHRTVCRRVLTLQDTMARLGERRQVEASHYDDWRVDRYNTGTLTSDGEKFDARSPARAASANLPDGTEVLVRNPANGRASHLRINDFGPFLAKREIDVTRRVAEDLGFAEIGVMALDLYVIAVPAPWEAVYRPNRRIFDPRGYIGVVPESAVPGLVASLLRERQRVTLSPTVVPREALQPLTATAPPPAPLVAETRPPRPTLAALSPTQSVAALAPHLVALSAKSPRETKAALPRLARLAAVEPPAATLTGRKQHTPELAAIAPSLPNLVAWSEEETLVAMARRFFERRFGAPGGVALAGVALGGLMTSAWLLSLGLAVRRDRGSTGLAAPPRLLSGGVPVPVPVPIPMPVPVAKPAPPRFANIIGPETSIAGRVTTKGDLLVMGTLTGSVQAGVIEIAAGAVVEATIEAAEIRIFGRVTGTLRADRVRIAEGAVVEGHILARLIDMAPSADVDAHLETARPAPRYGAIVSLTPKRAASMLRPPAQAPIVVAAE